MKKEEIIGCVCLILVFLIILPLLMALPTMWLWNGIVVDLTKNAVNSIGFWEALGLNVLCSILFKSSSTSSSKKE